MCDLNLETIKRLHAVLPESLSSTRRSAKQGAKKSLAEMTPFRVPILTMIHNITTKMDRICDILI
jgi:hypothetical protein